MSVNATFGRIVHAGISRWQTPPVNATGQPRLYRFKSRISRLFQFFFTAFEVATATDGAWYSTTALLSSRDRSQCLCVLRRRGSESKTRQTGEWQSLS